MQRSHPAAAWVGRSKNSVAAPFDQETLCAQADAAHPLQFFEAALYNGRSLLRGGAVWQLVGLITRRSQVQILPPFPSVSPRTGLFPFSLRGALPTCPNGNG